MASLKHFKNIARQFLRVKFLAYTAIVFMFTISGELEVISIAVFNSSSWLTLRSKTL